MRACSRLQRDRQAAALPHPPERTHAEEALRTSEARFRVRTEQASDLVSIVDGAGAFRYASPSYQTILGYPPAALQGWPLSHRLQLVQSCGVWSGAQEAALVGVDGAGLAAAT